MTIGGSIRRILGPRGVERARAASARPRHLIRRVIDTPGGADFGLKVVGLESGIADTRAEFRRVEQQDAILAGLTTGIEEVSARLDQFEDVAGARYDQAQLSHQAVLVKAERAARDTASLGSQLRQMLQEVLRRLDSLASTVAVIDSELHIPPYQAQPGLLTVTTDDGATTYGFDRTTTFGADYRSFEDVLRGPEGMIKERQRPYLAWAHRDDRVADLGCGRGELLELFREADIEAIGVDIDDSMIEHCKAKNLMVVQADVMEWIHDQPDASLDLVISCQFVEHLPPAQLPDLFAQTLRVLRPGGRFVAETVNPHCVPALRAFWIDPTHYQPLFPETLLLLLHAAGFAAAHVIYPCYTGTGEPRLGSGEYAVIARSE